MAHLVWGKNNNPPSLFPSGCPRLSFWARFSVRPVLLGGPSESFVANESWKQKYFAHQNTNTIISCFSSDNWSQHTLVRHSTSFSESGCKRLQEISKKIHNVPRYKDIIVISIKWFLLFTSYFEAAEIYWDILHRSAPHPIMGALWKCSLFGTKLSCNRDNCHI